MINFIGFRRQDNYCLIPCVLFNYKKQFTSSSEEVEIRIFRRLSFAFQFLNIALVIEYSPFIKQAKEK